MWAAHAGLRAATGTSAPTAKPSRCSSAQREIPAKTNEILDIKPKIEPLELAEQAVSADALHNQCETALPGQTEEGALFN
jgi:hypothetical protein